MTRNKTRKTWKQCQQKNGDSGYFGLCPICKNTDGYINIGRGHWYLCKEHKVRWFVGENLFSSWRDETEEEQRAIYDELDFGSFPEVEPFTPRAEWAWRVVTAIKYRPRKVQETKTPGAASKPPNWAVPRLHYSALPGEGYRRLNPGDIVSYELAPGSEAKRSRRAAAKVTVVRAATSKPEARP
jgi:hypothetical protein